MRLYRLGTAAFPIWDGHGAAAYGGRWNPPGVPVIYAAGSLALAMLEKLVQRRNLSRTLMVEVEVPADLAVDDLTQDLPPNWRAPNLRALNSPEAAGAGGRWLASRSAALLRVPSALVPREANDLANPQHPDAARLIIHDPEPLEWDARLFGIRPPA
jgi:RES domain-containing protein